jgi:hypothetical protein
MRDVQGGRVMDEKFVTSLEWKGMETKYILASIGTALIALEDRDLSRDDRELLKFYSEHMRKLSEDDR